MRFPRASSSRVRLGETGCAQRPESTGRFGGRKVGQSAAGDEEGQRAGDCFDRILSAQLQGVVDRHQDRAPCPRKPDLPRASDTISSGKTPPRRRLRGKVIELAVGVAADEGRLVLEQRALAGLSQARKNQHWQLPQGALQTWRDLA